MSVAVEPRAVRRTDRTARGGGSGVRGLAKMPALDGIRGLAIAGVLLFHGGHLRGGWLGVDLFFVLSGYLITSLLLVEWKGRGHRIELAAFWGRRARRLFPALLVLVCGASLYAVQYATPFDLGEIRWDGIATILYAANWHAIGASQNYFHVMSTPSPFQHTWSLAIEEQFYVVWPLLLLLILRRRRSVGRVVALTAGLAAVSVGLMIGLHASGATTGRLYYGTDTRASSLLFGGFVASWQAWRQNRAVHGWRWALVQSLGLYSLAGLMVAWVTLDGQSPFVYEGGLALCGIAAAALVASASNPRPGMAGRILSFAPLRGLGLISYGVYLYHFPLSIILSPGRTGLDGWPLFGLQVATTLGVALISYAMVEQPIRRRSLLKTAPRAIVAAVVAAVLAIVVLVASTNGAESVDMGGAPGVIGVTAFGPPGSPVVMIVGDSTAWTLAWQMAVSRDRFGLTVANWAVIACAPVYATGPARDWTGEPVPARLSPPCTPEWARGAASTRPSVAIVLFGGPPDNEVEIAGNWTHSCEPMYDNATRTIVASGIRGLLAHATYVVVMATPDRSPWGLVQFFPPITQHYIDCQNHVLQEVAGGFGPRVSWLDSNRLLCPDGSPCPKYIDGVAVRQDGLHFSDSDGSLVSSWVVQRISKDLAPPAKPVGPAAAGA